MKQLETKLRVLVDVVGMTEHKVGINTIIEVQQDIQKLFAMLKSDSVYTALRFADKNPSASGMNECNDKEYLHLYELSKYLKYGI